MAGHVSLDVHETVLLDGQTFPREKHDDSKNLYFWAHETVSLRTKPRVLQLSVQRPLKKRKSHRLRSAPKPTSRQPRFKDVLRLLRVASVQSGGVRGIKEFAEQMISKHNLQDNFYVIDLGRLERLIQAFQEALPRVRPFYALKCNPDKGMVALLASKGVGFDCASRGEMAQILETGVPPTDIIFAHACKRPACLEFAASHEVLRMTFDSESELEKIKERCPHAKCVLRIKADDPGALIQFGEKYGVHPYEEAPALLAAAKRLQVKVIGVSFHVGSGCQSGEAYRKAIEAARHVFDMGKDLGFAMDLLDIGGGFYGRFDDAGEVVLQSMAATINTALTEHFPEQSGVTVIAEPGRYFAECCCTFFSMVHTTKDIRATAGGPVQGRSVYLSDGVYGSFNCMMYDHQSIQSTVLRSPKLPAPSSDEWKPTTVFGPTCDSIDLIFKQVPMPQLRVSDWLQFPHLGAYAVSGACPFNGFPVDAPINFYVWSKHPVDRSTIPVTLKRESEAPHACVPEDAVRFVGDVHDLDIMH